jgi:mono/diheme cytochrome c family protein
MIERPTMRNILIGMVFGSVLSLGLILLQPLSLEAAGDPANGNLVYEKHCLVCHGLQGKGDGPTGKMLKPPPADFTSAASKTKTEADLRQIIENGKPGTAMPPWKGQLSETDIMNVMAYLSTLRK